MAAVPWSPFRPIRGGTKSNMAAPTVAVIPLRLSDLPKAWYASKGIVRFGTRRIDVGLVAKKEQFGDEVTDTSRTVGQIPYLKVGSDEFPPGSAAQGDRLAT